MKNRKKIIVILLVVLFILLNYSVVFGLRSKTDMLVDKIMNVKNIDRIIMIVTGIVSIILIGYNYYKFIGEPNENAGQFLYGPPRVVNENNKIENPKKLKYLIRMKLIFLIAILIILLELVIYFKCNDFILRNK